MPCLPSKTAAKTTSRSEDCVDGALVRALSGATLGQSAGSVTIRV